MKKEEAKKPENQKEPKVNNSETSQNTPPVATSGTQKDFMAAAMLSLFLGWFGIDRFYLGYVGSGILKLITFGGCGLWYLIDLILILTGSLKSVDKQDLKDRQKNIKLALIITAVVFGIGLLMSIVSSATRPPTTSNTQPQQQVQKTEEAKKDEPKKEEPKQPEVPTEYKSALSKATSYANNQHMSKLAVYDQLTSEYGEKFSAAAAQYAVDNVKADWNANALVKAKSYQSIQNMSPEAIRDQLTSQYGEKFTPAEADYAIQNLNN
ncbi:MAG: Ltp family lipoprotein [Patescibacteria group bacterium]|nr:Ltp family lipoprotein [Patescibacteria group bacterium]